MSPRVEIELAQSVLEAVEAMSRDTGEPVSGIVGRLLADALDLGSHELFQVSTSGALVRGVFSGAISVADLRRHGDFGLGTFADLDGELLLVDGEAFQAAAGGRVVAAEGDWAVPFALITSFKPDLTFQAAGKHDLLSLGTEIDGHRSSSNQFAAVRGDGRFDSLSMRAVCRAEAGESLIEATTHQSEFEVQHVAGTLVGFWSPSFAQALSIPGYHFHFLATDRSVAGHVFDFHATDLEIGIQIESDLHVALPQTAEFLAADLTGEISGDLETAEQRPR